MKTGWISYQRCGFFSRARFTSSFYFKRTSSRVSKSKFILKRVQVLTSVKRAQAAETIKRQRGNGSQSKYALLSTLMWKLITTDRLLTHQLVFNNIQVVAMAGNCLFRWDLESPCNSNMCRSERIIRSHDGINDNELMEQRYLEYLE